MSAKPRIAILGPSPIYHEHWLPSRNDYARLFTDGVTFIGWQDVSDDLSGYDLVLPLLAWGYHQDSERWFALLDRAESENWNLVNPAAVLRWNSDKSYLLALAQVGVSAPPSMTTPSLDEEDVAIAREKWGKRVIVKPLVSGGADGTFLLDPSTPLPTEVARKRMMIQPFLAQIATEGELSLFYFGGRFSHAICKRPVTGDFRVQPQFGGTDQAINPPAAATMLAEKALSTSAAMTGVGKLAYARVDMVNNGSGGFWLMELELIEPALFLHHAPCRGTKLREAVMGTVR